MKKLKQVKSIILKYVFNSRFLALISAALFFFSFIFIFMSKKTAAFFSIVAFPLLFLAAILQVFEYKKHCQIKEKLEIKTKLKAKKIITDIVFKSNASKNI